MTPEEKLSKMLVEFRHTVRESWQGRAKLSQPDDDKWPFYPPIVGAVLGRQMEVLAVVEEEPRLKGEDQFEFHCIRAPDYGQGELNFDTSTPIPLCNSRGRQLRRYRQMLEWSGGHLEGVAAFLEQRHLRLQQMTFLQKLREIRLLF